MIGRKETLAKYGQEERAHATGWAGNWRETGAIEEYERLHAQVWPEVLATLYACNVRNYTIFRHEQTLFAYFEYMGEDFAADMAKIASDLKTREWWTHTDSLQEPLPTRAEGEWWLTMREIFHMD